MPSSGVRALLAPGAVGSLQPGIHPGELVVVDQLVDRTWGRADTFHDDFATGVVHVGFADSVRRRRCGAVLVETGRAARADGARRRHARRDPGSAILDRGRVCVGSERWAGRS